MSHTKGPWVVQYATDHPSELLVKPVPGQVVCDIFPLSDVKETEANAVLISAAPDLLEALLMIQDCGLRPECIAAAENAINKATAPLAI